MSARKTILSLITLAFLLLFPVNVHAERYILCLGCDGTGKCELCDPAKGSDRLGDGYMQCWLCHQTGYAICGTNHTGDGTPIGCDGSGHLPDGSICPVCNGEGRYPCDVCGGTGIFECKCRQLGQPGLCTQCFGTGWRLINTSGVCYNTTPVYPSDGSTIDTSNFGYMGTMTYDASRYGLGITAAQFKAIKDGNSGNNNSGGNNNPQDNPGDNPGPQPQPNPEGSGDEHPEDNPLEPLCNDNSFFIEIGSDAEIKKEIASQEDEIYFICRYVAGEHLFSVKGIMSQLYDSELDTIHGMSEADINEFRGHLEAAANGIDYTDYSDGPDSIYIEFGCDRIEYFPFRCEVLIEVPIANGHDQCKLYYVEDEKFYDVPVCPVRNVDSAGEHEYLIFTIDRFGKFIYINQAVNSEGSNLPEIYPVILDSQESDIDSNTANINTEPGSATATPGPDSSDDSAGSSKATPAIIIILIAVCACAGGAFYLKKKKN